MKTIMKKALSLMLVLAMTIAPITAYAATLGEYENPYVVKVNAAAIDVTIDVEAGVYVKADNSNGSVLTVESASHSNYIINYCRMPYAPENGATNNAMTLPMIAEVDFVYISNTVNFQGCVGIDKNSGYCFNYCCVSYIDRSDILC